MHPFVPCTTPSLKDKPEEISELYSHRLANVKHFIIQKTQGVSLESFLSYMAQFR